MTLCLSEADIRAVLPMADLIGAMETALAAFSAGQVVQPMRPVVEMGEAAFFSAMPGFVRDPAVLGAKLVAIIGANQARGLPTHRASILLLDPETGALIALMDGRLITEMRTAAVSAVSAKYMARADASVLAIRLRSAGAQPSRGIDAMASPRRGARLEPHAGSRAAVRGGIAHAGPRMPERCGSRPRRRYRGAGNCLRHASHRGCLGGAWRPCCLGRSLPA